MGGMGGTAGWLQMQGPVGGQAPASTVPAHLARHELV